MEVTHPEVYEILHCIAIKLQLLDALCADYFCTVLAEGNLEVIREMLDEAKKQTQQAEELGDLGNYSIVCTGFVQNSVSHVTRLGVGHQPVILLLLLTANRFTRISGMVSE